MLRVNSVCTQVARWAPQSRAQAVACVSGAWPSSGASFPRSTPLKGKGSLHLHPAGRSDFDIIALSCQGSGLIAVSRLLSTSPSPNKLVLSLHKHRTS